MQLTPPCSAPSCWWLTLSVWATSPLGIVVRHVICGFYFFIYFPPGYVALWVSKTPHRSASEKVSWCLETSPLSQLPPWDESPSLTLLSLFLPFIFCPTSFRRQWAAFLGPTLPCRLPCLVSSASIHKLFCGICSVFRWSFGEFVGKKVVPPPACGI